LILSKVQHEHGYLYTVSLADLRAAFPYRIDHDWMDGNPSNLQLLEDGHPIGIPHSLHASIASLGGGRYSHWYSYLYFSTPDNVDPRSGANRFSVIVEARPGFALWLAVSLSGALSLALLLKWIRPTVLRAVRQTKFGRGFAATDKSSICGPLLPAGWLVALVFTVLSARWLFVPPVFWDIDSAVLVFHPLYYVPHWPWLAPVLTYFATQAFGLTPLAMSVVCLVQLLIYGGCIVVLVGAFTGRAAQIIVALGLLLQFYMLVMEGAVSTEPLGSAGLLLGVAATVLYIERVIVVGEADPALVVRCLLLFGLCIWLVANTRLPMLPLACIFPVTVGLHWFGSHLIGGRTRYRMLVLGSCAALTLIVLLQASATNNLVCRLVGSANCESPYGKSGSEVIAFALRKLDSDSRITAVANLEQQTDDPLVKKVFEVAADDSVVASWHPIQEAIRADAAIIHDPSLQVRLSQPGELERVTGRATWIFQTKGGEVFWSQVGQTAVDYLLLRAIMQLAAGDLQVLQAPPFHFAQDWFTTSAFAVLTVQKDNLERISIFDNPPKNQHLYSSFADNLIVDAFDTVNGPIVSEITFVLVFLIVLISCLRNPRMVPLLAFCGSTFITIGGYSLIMAASVGPILYRYRMPSCFLITTMTLCSIGVLLDVWEMKPAKSRAQPRPAPIP
jgi:hypothetical protein